MMTPLLKCQDLHLTLMLHEVLDPVDMHRSVRIQFEFKTPKFRCPLVLNFHYRDAVSTDSGAQRTVQ